MRKLMLVLMVVGMLAASANATIDDVWNLRDDFSVTNGNANVVGDGAWGYMETYNSFRTVTETDPFPAEWPPGVGWAGTAAHLTLAQFSDGTGETTNFNTHAGSPGNEVGGHSPFGVSFFSVTGGTFDVEVRAYNARGTLGNNQIRLTVNGISNGSWVGPDDTPIDIVDNVGWDNAVTKSYAFQLLANPTGDVSGAGDYLIIEVLNNGGDDWAGLDITITQVPDPTGSLVIVESGDSTDTTEDSPPLTPDDSFTVALGLAPVADVNVAISAVPTGQLWYSGPGDLDVLTFTTANWSTPQTVEVQAIDDELFEGPHNVNVILDPSSTDLNYSSLSNSYVTVHITDNDCSSFPETDFNEDCDVDLADFAIFAADWLTDNSVQN